jgi:copper chaperone NosL
MNKIIVSIFSVCIFLVSCSTEPQPINFGKDLCAHCSMTIMDKKFGAEMVNSKGKAIKFDSGECMVGYINSENKFEAVQHLIVNYNSEGELIKAEDAFFLHGGNVNSPMGGNLATFKTKADAEKIQGELGGDILNWNDVKNIKF